MAPLLQDKIPDKTFLANKKRAIVIQVNIGAANEREGNDLIGGKRRETSSGGGGVCARTREREGCKRTEKRQLPLALPRALLFRAVPSGRCGKKKK